MKTFSIIFFSAAMGLTTAASAGEPGFVSLFDGKTLDGWKLVGKHGGGYEVEEGTIACVKGGGGNLFTEKEFADFILRFEFKLDKGSNNGVGIRAPLEGDAAYMGMEIQVLDDDDPQYATLQPWQYHGSVYGVVAAKRGAQKPVGQWNEEEIQAVGRHIKVTVNGKVTVDTNLNDVTDAAKLQAHPGMLRARGHIGFLGHNDHVQFRHIQIKEMPVGGKENTPPDGFVALFNGKDLSGWKGLLAQPNDNPAKRAALSPAETLAAQEDANKRMKEHWHVTDGVIEFDGKGLSLCTAKDYRDFEMMVDWKIKDNGDSGIYLRGSPQVQIWDFNHWKIGSGGLYNNQKNPHDPLKIADSPIGEWNSFRILMVGEKVHVFLNGELVVHNTTLENYWERDKPIYPAGQIELQNHGDTLWFKNLYLREIPRN